MCLFQDGRTHLQKASQSNNSTYHHQAICTRTGCHQEQGNSHPTPRNTQGGWCHSKPPLFHASRLYQEQAPWLGDIHQRRCNLVTRWTMPRWCRGWVDVDHHDADTIHQHDCTWSPWCIYYLPAWLVDHHGADTIHQHDYTWITMVQIHVPFTSFATYGSPWCRYHSPAWLHMDHSGADTIHQHDYIWITMVQIPFTSMTNTWIGADIIHQHDHTWITVVQIPLTELTPCLFVAAWLTPHLFIAEWIIAALGITLLPTWSCLCFWHQSPMPWKEGEGIWIRI